MESSQSAVTKLLSRQQGGRQARQQPAAVAAVVAAAVAAPANSCAAILSLLKQINDLLSDNPASTLITTLAQKVGSHVEQV
jgi:hypothetical protein